MSGFGLCRVSSPEPCVLAQCLWEHLWEPPGPWWLVAGDPGLDGREARPISQSGMLDLMSLLIFNKLH